LKEIKFEVCWNCRGSCDILPRLSSPIFARYTPSGMKNSFLLVLAVSVAGNSSPNPTLQLSAKKETTLSKVTLLAQWQPIFNYNLLWSDE
jgi:hypothetical protein